MTDFPDLKLKTLVSFPAVVNSGTGIAVTRQSGAFRFDLNYQGFAQVPSIAPPNDANNYVLSFDVVQKTFTLIPVTWLRS
jgi:hypothetical protein